MIDKNPSNQCLRTSSRTFMSSTEATRTPTLLLRKFCGTGGSAGIRPAQRLIVDSSTIIPDDADIVDSARHHVHASDPVHREYQRVAGTTLKHNPALIGGNLLQRTFAGRHTTLATLVERVGQNT